MMIYTVSMKPMFIQNQDYCLRRRPLPNNKSRMCPPSGYRPLVALTDCVARAAEALWVNMARDAFEVCLRRAQGGPFAL